MDYQAKYQHWCQNADPVMQAELAEIAGNDKEIRNAFSVISRLERAACAE